MLCCQNSRHCRLAPFNSNNALPDFLLAGRTATTMNSPVQSSADLDPTVSINEFSVQMLNPDLQPALEIAGEIQLSPRFLLFLFLILFGHLRTGEALYTRHVHT
ncbi:hypothetical protein Vi05172_g2050 [Venturia inaequalis]|nr:hypothetical protein Vi05172_g2050 [Venturia inaequalis]